ncbi:hypothetical protein ACFRJ9_19620 [Paenarthrobacter sp. NPDC056912]|uniref:DUF7927 domain-containing protein n=1 Tax=Paenarthrobacter sp. NPDC056912 TaxID=3345965 RepID=UPI00366E9A62
MGIRAAVAATIVAFGVNVVPAAGLELPMSIAVPVTDGSASNKGAKEPAEVLFEDFESTDSNASSLSKYISDGRAAYTADSYWLDESLCNGLVLSYNSGATGSCPADDEGGAGSRQNLQRLADILGQKHLHDLNTGDTPTSMRSTTGQNPLTASQANHALGNVTKFTDAPLDLVEFQTTENLALRKPNRFLTFSADVADVSCGAGGAVLAFFFVDAAGKEIPVTETPYSVCTDPEKQILSSPLPEGTSGWVFGGDTGAVGTMGPSAASLVSGNSVGVTIRNHTPVAAGNDHGIDNVLVRDVTPFLEQKFSKSYVKVGETAELQIVIRNTTDLAAKEGWTFTSVLPKGLSVTENDKITTTCPNGAAYAETNRGSFTISGDLGQGQESCTATVTVSTSGVSGGDPQPGTYASCGSNYGTPIGLDLPDSCALLHVQGKPTLTVSTTSKASAKMGNCQIVHYTLSASNTGTEDYTPDHPAVVTQDLKDVPKYARYNGDATASSGASPTVSAESLLQWEGELAAGEAVVITYSVTFAGETDEAVCLSHEDEGRPEHEPDIFPVTHASKSVDPASGTKVEVNQNLNYILTFSNTGTGRAWIDRTENLSGLLDDATLSTFPFASKPAWTVTARLDGTYRIQGFLNPGETVDIRYAATVKADGQRGDQLIDSVLMPSGEDSSASPADACNGDQSTCTTNPVHSWAAKITADKSTVLPGDTVTYTATITNSGASLPVSDSPLATIDLTDALAGASYDGIASEGIDYEAPRLILSAELAKDEQRKFTFSAAVNSPNVGPKNLRISIAGGTNCHNGSPDTACLSEIRLISSVNRAPNVEEAAIGESVSPSTPANGVWKPNPTMLVSGFAALLAGLLGNLSRARLSRRAGSQASE